jgi:hypothetical protein
MLKVMLLKEPPEGKTMNDKLPLKQSLLRTLIGALILSALIGIYAFLFGNFGETEVKILFTTLLVSYFSVTSLACAAAFEKKKMPVMSMTGLVLGIVGFLMFVPGIWAEWFDSEPYAKAMIILGIFSFSFAQACLLSLATLEHRFHWVLYTALVSIFALALMASGMIVFEVDAEWLFRFSGVIGILDGCATVSIPVLCKIGTNKFEQFSKGPYQNIELRCPRCGQQGMFPLGEIECGNCSLKIRVELEENSNTPVTSVEP